MGTRIGFDLVEVEEVRAALRTHAERYLGRIYTEGEVRDCRAGGEVDPRRLAARFAAKEATIKALRPVDDRIPWRDIEVRCISGGATEVALSGVAAISAREQGLTSFVVSLTRQPSLAGAVVVADTRSVNNVPRP